MGTTFDQKLKNAYVAAKSYAMRGDAVNARNCVLECMESLLELYKITKSPSERARIYAKVVEFKDISSELHKNGVNQKVKAWFCIAETAKKEAPTENKRTVTSDDMLWTEKVFRNNCSSVMSICCVWRNGECFSGTGFSISENGYLLTNHHVVYDENKDEYCKIIYATPFGQSKSYKIKLIAADEKSDVALCKYDPTEIDGLTAVKRIDDYERVSQGMGVLSIGNGLSMGLAPISGIIKFTKGTLVTTVPLNKGDSGSPVFNSNGECIGINCSTTTEVIRGNYACEAVGISNATPMCTIDKLLDKWCAKHGIQL